MSPVIFRRLLLAALSLQAFAGCSEDPAPQTRAVPGAESVATTGLRLNEIGFRPGDGAPAFAEIGNSGSAAISLDGAILRSESGASFELPPGMTIEPGALLVVSFDNRNGFTDGAMHAPAADFPAREAGSVRLEIPQGPADAVIWGMPDLASVDLCRGGRCASPALGSVLARLPNTKEPFTPAVWALLDPELATPGEPNPRPPVSAFAAIPGMIFTGTPRFSWYGVPGAVSYRLQVARDDAFKSLMHEADVAATAGVRLEQLTAHGPELPPGHYFWRVQALGAAGESAPFSRPMPFSIDPSRRLPSGSRAPRQAPAGDRPPAGTPGDGTARSAAEPPRIPEGLLEVLEVPVLDHAKDTRMLALEAPREEPLWSWDTPDFAGYPYCARAGVAMVNAFYRGRLSQDRIGYEVYKNLREGPEYDLPVVGIMDRHTSEYALPLAIGTSGQYERNPYIAFGEDRNACMDYISERALESCASQCVTRESKQCAQCRIARTDEISCPVEIAYRWGQHAIEDIQREIDAGRPIIATTPSHLFLIVGYRLQDGHFSFFYQDAGGREEVVTSASGLTRSLDSYWTGLAPIKVGSDEPEVRRDSDGDGVVDFDEIERFGTDPANDDSDGDGVKDKQEIRASVWDPEHGYHSTAATLASTAPYSEVKEKAESANLSGRDFDRDGLAMELDHDSDGGGCDDGNEDANLDGRRNGDETWNFDKTDDECKLDEQPTYLWEGRIEVDNVFHGSTIAVDVHGRHKWRGVYQVKFLEQWTSAEISVLSLSGDSVLDFGVNEVVPLQMSYSILADHHHEYDDPNGDVTLRGQAVGKIKGDELRGLLRGRVLRFETPVEATNASSWSESRSFASFEDYNGFESHFYTMQNQQGCYQLNLSFGGSFEHGTLAQQRQRYRGIDRGGSSPIHPDPDADFFRVMPAYMPDGTNVYGCLDEPEQTEVQGELVFPTDSGPLNNPAQISIKWWFARSPCRAGSNCAAVEDEYFEPGPSADSSAGDDTDDACGPPVPQRALLDTALAQQRAILQPLGALLREQQSIQQQAGQWQNDFVQATRDCRLWSLAKLLVGTLAGGGVPAPAGSGPVPQGKQFWNFLDMVEKLGAGDASWLLPNHEFGDWVSVEDAWNSFTIAYGALGPSSPQSLREGLQQCGAPTYEGVLDGAYEYLDLLEQLPALGERMNKTLNDARAKDNEIFDLWHKYQRACREYEQCRDGDPGRCDTPPGPDVPMASLFLNMQKKTGD